MAENMERTPKAGEIYRHFKGNLYQIVAVAAHSETGEKLVIYQALYGDYGVYARPLELFVSEVDGVKYPKAGQNYRFEKVMCAGETTETKQESVCGKMAARDDNANANINAFEKNAVCGKARPEQEQASAEESINAKMMAFFDADDLEDKYNILVSMRDEVTDHMINNMAVVMDVVIPEGDIDERYEALKRCIQTRQRYERERLR